MKQRQIRIGSRESRLAIAQTRLVMRALEKRFPDVEWVLKTFKTTGDKILDKSLDKIGGKGLFVKELDRALLDGAIDYAVHSLKDVPMEHSPELPLVSFIQRGDPRDALVLSKQAQSDGLSLGECRIGSSSKRRQFQLQLLWEEPRFAFTRGNIHTRIRKLDEGQYDALILAAAGLKRVDLAERITRFFSVDEMIPAAGQGTLVLQGRSGEDHSEVCSADHTETKYAALAERSFVRTLEGGCSSPIAAYATVSGGQLTLTALYYHEESGRHAIGSEGGRVEDAERIGSELAMILKGRCIR